MGAGVLVGMVTFDSVALGLPPVLICRPAAQPYIMVRSVPKGLGVGCYGMSWLGQNLKKN